MIFIDASALIAIIAKEPFADDLAACLETDFLCYSAMSAWETMAGLYRSHRYEPARARAAVKIYVDTLEIQAVSMGLREYDLAAAAYEKFGKGRHKAALNMGDCFAYACAKANRAKLLFIGNDFALTDVAAART